MRTQKDIIFFYPKETKKILDYNLKTRPPKFYYNYQKFILLINKIVDLSNTYKEQKYFYISSSFKMLFIGTKAPKYIKYLVDIGIFATNKSYQAGVFSLGYKISSKVAKGVVNLKIKSKIKVGLVILKIEIKKRRLNKIILPKHLLTMRTNFFKQVDFDFGLAHQWIEENADNSKQANYYDALSRIEDKRFRYFSRNETNFRLDTNLTNLKSELLQFIKGSFVEIDLRNSQPFFLGMLLESILKSQKIVKISKDKREDNITSKPTQSNTTPNALNLYVSLFESKISHFKNEMSHSKKNMKPFLAEIRAYNTKTVDGTFYGFLADETYKNSGVKYTIKEMKSIMLPVLFSKNEYELDNGYKFIPWKKNKQLFSDVFPYISDAVKSFKKENNVDFPVFLQRMESYMFIDLICDKLVKNGIVPLTKHDSIIVDAKHSDRTLKIMQDSFKETFDTIPTFRIKPLKKQLANA